MANSEQINLSALRIDRGTNTAPSAGGKSKRTWIIVGAVAGLILLILFLGGVLFKSAPVVETSVVTLVNPAQANQVLIASGYVVAQRKASVASKGTGRLEALLVQEGDPVSKNQIIGRLESSDIEAALQQARANLNVAKAGVRQAQAELSDAKVNAERMKSLLGQGSVSQADFDAAEARYKRADALVQSAEAAVKAAEAVVRSAEVQLENTRIRAPFDGTVLTKNADVGEVVAPFGAASNSKGAVVTIADMSSLEVEADVSESNIERIRPDQPCEITLDAFPDARYRGVVGKIVPTADRAKATVMTKVRFVDRDKRVLPEMSAKVSFLSEAISDSAIHLRPKLGVNPAAIRTKDGMKYAWVLNGDKLVRKTVTVGGSVGTMIEVLAGLAAGDRVVLDPREDFTDGMRVGVESK